MRWIWIDRILELKKAERCVAIKNISLAEQVLHDHFPATDHYHKTPVMPNTLIIEGMAQTAGILVGHVNDFRENVILAKITKAQFTAAAYPGDSLRFVAMLEQIDGNGARTNGTVTRTDPATGLTTPLGQIALMFSHVSASQLESVTLGQTIPRHNFVFSDQLIDLLHQSGLEQAQTLDPKLG